MAIGAKDLRRRVLPPSWQNEPPQQLPWISPGERNPYVIPASAKKSKRSPLNQMYPASADDVEDNT